MEQKHCIFKQTCLFVRNLLLVGKVIAMGKFVSQYIKEMGFVVGCFVCFFHLSEKIANKTKKD